MVQIATIFIRLLTAAFLIGMVGSAVVVVIRFVEDFRELFSHD